MNYDIVILGSGESGTGAALLAHKMGLSVFVSDMGMIPDKYKVELNERQIPFEEGKHTENIILEAKEIIKSPGIPEKAPMIKKIREKNIFLMSEIEFAHRYKGDSKIVAITGSNGKTTTTSLVFDMFKRDGKNASIVGNIGYSFARQIATEPTEWYIMEVSSFQLDDVHVFQPEIAVITNITPDHLDRYDYDFNKYVKAKFNISKNQTEHDRLILCKEDEACNNYINQHKTNPKKYFFSMTEQINENGAYVNQFELVFNVNGQPFNISINELSLKGKHNQYNSMAAGISARSAEVRSKSIRESFQTFTAIEHRMVTVASIRGVEFINDSKATNVNSTWYALECSTKPTVLILGGVDKGNDYQMITDLVRERVKAIVCLGVDNTAIVNAFRNVVPVIETNSMIKAVQASYELSVPGDCVLLSPACASFDLFKNYEDRGEQFTQAVFNL